MNPRIEIQLAQQHQCRYLRLGLMHPFLVPLVALVLKVRAPLLVLMLNLLASVPAVIE